MSAVEEIEARNAESVARLLAAGLPEPVLTLIALQVRVETLVQFLAPPAEALFELTYEEHMEAALTVLFERIPAPQSKLITPDGP